MPNKGYKHSKKHNQKISIARKGNNYRLGYKHSDETKQKISLAQRGEKNHNYGKNLSDETKEKISKAGKGRKCSDETKEKISKAGKGRKCSDETKEKMSKASKGQIAWNKNIKRTEETKVKISKANKGKKSWLGKKHSQKSKEKMSVSATTNMIYKIVHPRGKGSYYKNTKIWMRSSWEIEFATLLDKYNIKWQYEPKAFKLKEGKRYIPDFFLEQFNLWIEIRPKVKQKKDSWKLEKVRELYGIEIIMLDRKWFDGLLEELCYKMVA